MTQNIRRGNKCALCHMRIHGGEDWLPAGTYDNGKAAFAHALCYLTPVELGTGAVTIDASHRYAGYIHGKFVRLA